MNYVKKLGFVENPDYPYLKAIITNLARDKRIDIFDRIYDWSLKAVMLKKYP